MSYAKHNFVNGNPLIAAQLNEMEEGIAKAYDKNIENGKGTESIQQIPRSNAIKDKDGEGDWVFSIASKNSYASLVGLNTNIKYGATGANSASFCGRNGALGSHSMAVNSQTVAKGDESFAANYCSIAAGGGSFACGSKNCSEGNHSFTEGEGNHAKGTNSHAAGEKTKAEGRGAYSIGFNTLALHDYSFASGSYTKATKACQMVVGKYSYDTDQNDSLFVVGSGTSDVNRKNALEICSSDKIIIRWRDEYYVLQDILNILSDCNNTLPLNEFIDAKISRT